MISLQVVVDGTDAFPELRGARIIQPNPSSLAITALPSGLQSGRTSVAIIVPLSDGSYVFAENTMANFIKAALAFATAYPEEWRAAGVRLVVEGSEGGP